jgi:D-serine deaminase-like pyridoxal phosphate-dependent protein
MKINSPALIIDEGKVKRNIRRMQQKAKSSDVIFRPHFKTHQSILIGQLFREAGVQQITVSSVAMAEYFAADGWDNITIAFPLNLRELAEINKLSARIRLNVLVESTFVAAELAQKAANATGVFIKIDTGYHRTGLAPDSFPEIDKILSVVASSRLLHFEGFLTHAGHSYHTRSKAEVLKIMQRSAAQLQHLKLHYQQRFPDMILSYGDTPSCSMATHCEGFDEIRPGNFVYYDVMQYHLGSCRLEDIAVVAACPVVAIHPERSEMVIYGGEVHLSKEFIDAENDFHLYGYIVRFDKHYHWGKPVDGAYVSALSQEHGVIRLPEKELRTFRPGDLIGVLPIHSCLTANLLKDNTVLV